MWTVMESGAMIDVMPVQETGFRSDLDGAMGKMRRAFQELLTAAGEPRRPTDLQRLFGVSYAICWHVFRIARSEEGEGVEQATNVPTPAALKRLLAAAREAGVSEGITERVRASAEAFRELVKKHAGSRETFESMIAGVVGETTSAAEAVDLQNRRTMYRCASHLWGAQIATFGYANLYRVVERGDPFVMEGITVTSRLGVRRFRADASLRLLSYHPAREEETGVPGRFEALDGEAMEKYGAPVMPGFCSRAMQSGSASLSIRENGNWREVMAASKDLGLKSSADFSFGWSTRGVLQGYAPESRNSTCTTFQLPVGLVIQDLLLHRETLGDKVPTVRVVHKTSDDFTPEGVRKMPVLPPAAKVMSLGKASEVIDTGDWPGYGAMLRYACGRKGWELSEFDLYRVRIEYPIMHSMIAIEHSL